MCKIGKYKAPPPLCKMPEHLLLACVVCCQQERKLCDGELDYERLPVEYQEALFDEYWSLVYLQKNLVMA